MNEIEIRHLCFAYPDQKNALSDINLSVRRGEYVLLRGASGSGKTSLLRHLKKSLTPFGTRSGEILFNGIPLDSLSLRDDASQIGYLMQDPEDQIVTDHVWHELAFGLESLGVGQDEMRKLIDQTARFFGIEDLLGCRTCDLSGGQKQLVNLASVMALQPDLLLLDEPTGQLDPASAETFLNALSQVNKELGTTVIIAEQRLGLVLPAAGRIITLDGGQIVSDVPGMGACEERFYPHASKDPSISGDPERFAVTVSDLSFRFSPSGPDILDKFSIRIPEKQITALTGRNGSGKTTLLKILSGILKPCGDCIQINGRTAMLPQEPKNLFVRKTVREDLLEMTDSDEFIRAAADLFGLGDLLDSHPFDLSGGQLQRAALAKVWLTGADILLLDEPTKGMDYVFKTALAGILRDLKEQGKTILLVSHDTEFCEAFADQICPIDTTQDSMTCATPAEIMSRTYEKPQSRPSAARVERPLLQASRVILTACMTALAVLVRAAFVMTPHIRPMGAVIMITGMCLGPVSGMVSGALAAYLSNFIYGGQGPWTPWQMAAFALAGLLMGLLVRKKLLNPNQRLPVALTGGLVTFALVGPLLDTSSVFVAVKAAGGHPAPDTILGIYRAGIPVNAVHAAAVAATLLILCKPVYGKLTRYLTKNGLDRRSGKHDVP